MNDQNPPAGHFLWFKSTKIYCEVIIIENQDKWPKSMIRHFLWFKSAKEHLPVIIIETQD